MEEAIQAQSSRNLEQQHSAFSFLLHSIFTCAPICSDARSLSSCKSCECLNSFSLSIRRAENQDPSLASDQITTHPAPSVDAPPSGKPGKGSTLSKSSVSREQ